MILYAKLKFTKVITKNVKMVLVTKEENLF
jgi:hypothetical protein